MHSEDENYVIWRSKKTPCHEICILYLPKYEFY